MKRYLICPRGKYRQYLVRVLVSDVTEFSLIVLEEIVNMVNAVLPNNDIIETHILRKIELKRIAFSHKIAKDVCV